MIRRFNENLDNIYFVYCFLDPRKPGNYKFGDITLDHEPIYIGKGKGNRHQNHYKLYKTRNTRFYSKIQSIIEKGYEPKFIILSDNLSEKESFLQECHFIELIGKIENGGPLTNLTDGGQGHSGLKKSDETILKFSNSMKKHYKTNLKQRRDGFLKKSKDIHNNKYDYSLVDYKNAHTKVDIKCPIHGIFKQSLHAHTSGEGCPSCSGNKKMGNEDFIKRSSEKFNNLYDYSLVDYINNRTNVKIICQKHGIFEQIPETHLNGKGCPSCLGVSKKTTSEFIKNSISIHGDRYDYSNCTYTGIFNKVKIICKKHGEFEQAAKNHLNGQGCRQCYLNKRRGL